ncbi:hypothetical protein [Lacinutrix salivirga]
MKDKSFWETFTSYMKFRTIVPAIILIVLVVILIAKVLYNKIIS